MLSIHLPLGLLAVSKILTRYIGYALCFFSLITFEVRYRVAAHSKLGTRLQS